MPAQVALAFFIYLTYEKVSLRMDHQLRDKGSLSLCSYFRAKPLILIPFNTSGRNPQFDA
ncbi:MAG: hypothetical protein BGO59_05530 [Spirosoma sp. 48-14]|nr:MAG: hypothetical protein BGO59_05530 [Spirosoma sp. 48-14]